MMMIPIHVIAFFMAIMMVPEDVKQFTIAVQGEEIQWTRQEAGWRAVELPRDDLGIYSTKRTEVTISAEGREMKTNISRFLTMPENLDWKKAAEIQVAIKSLGDPVQIQRGDGKIVLSQAKGELFGKPVTITWKPAGEKVDTAARETVGADETVKLWLSYVTGEKPNLQAALALMSFPFNRDGKMLSQDETGKLLRDFRSQIASPEITVTWTDWRILSRDEFTKIIASSKHASKYQKSEAQIDVMVTVISKAVSVQPNFENVDGNYFGINRDGKITSWFD